MKILIAEDNEVSRIMLSSGLQKRGYEVVETADGEEAWQRMQEADPPPVAFAGYYDAVYGRPGDL